MKWVKELWFPVATLGLLAVIAFNLSRIVAIQSPAAPAKGTPATPSEQADGQQKLVPDGFLPSPGSQQIAIGLRAKDGDSKLDGDQVAGTVKTLGSVEEAVFADNTLKVTLTDSTNLSDLLGRLSLQEASVDDDQFPINGALRLHATGMT